MRGQIAAILAGIFISCAPVVDVSADPTSAAPYGNPWVEISGLTDGAREASIQAFFPIQDYGNALFFLGVDGTAFFEDYQGLFEGAQNVGAYLGYRKAIGPDSVLGVWGGLDFEHTLLDNDFTRLIGGLQAVSGPWSIQVNGFLPVGKSRRVDSSAASDRNAAPVSSALDAGADLWENAATGINAEIGTRLPFDLFDDAGQLEEFRLTGSIYHYFDFLDAGSITGGRLRGEVDFYPFDGRGGPDTRVTLSTEYRFDELRKGQFQTGLRISIPLGGASRAVADASDGASFRNMRRELFRPVRRDTDVVTGVSGSGPSGRYEFLVTNTDIVTLNAPAGLATLELSESDPFVFGAVFSGDSSIATFTLTNTGTAAATDIGGSLSNNPFYFAANPYPVLGIGTFPGNGGTCGDTLSPGDSCTLRVAMTGPATVDTFYDTLTINYNNGTGAASVTKGLQVTTFN